MSSTSKRRLRITVNGKPYLVEIDKLTASPPSGYSAITVTVNGRPYMVNIETTEHLSGTSVETVPADEPAAAPERVTRQTSAPGKAAVSHEDALGRADLPSDPPDPQANAIRAPMPGNILDITVKPGDKVSIRQQLCSLEAMKMKNAIHSPQDGVIASVEVTEGQAVAYGDVLFTFASGPPSGK